MPIFQSKSLIYIVFLVFISIGNNPPVDEINIDETDQDLFRVMTYNIHHGEGIDGNVDLERITDLINKIEPDILLLQEVDVDLERSGKINIPAFISEKTELTYIAFGQNLTIENGAYGNATLSTFPLISTRNFQFEQIGPEQRGVLTTEISVGQRNVLIMNSHFDHSLDDSERILYAEKIIQEILPTYQRDAVLFGGDFNDIPNSLMYQKLSVQFNDAWTVSGKGDGFTIPADQPSTRIDYLLFNGDIKSDSTWNPQTYASDHLPVVADFYWMDDQ